MSKKEETVRMPDNWSPNRVIIKDEGDGRTSYFSTNKGTNSHGHSVQNSDGSVDYSRAFRSDGERGSVVKDSRKE